MKNLKGVAHIWKEAEEKKSVRQNALNEKGRKNTT
jgi:hypothetical protein